MMFYCWSILIELQYVLFPRISHLTSQLIPSQSQSKVETIRFHFIDIFLWLTGMWYLLSYYFVNGRRSRVSRYSIDYFINWFVYIYYSEFDSLRLTFGLQRQPSVLCQVMNCNEIEIEWHWVHSVWSRYRSSSSSSWLLYYRNVTNREHSNIREFRRAKGCQLGNCYVIRLDCIVTYFDLYFLMNFGFMD